MAQMPDRATRIKSLFSAVLKPNRFDPWRSIRYSPDDAESEVRPG
jgi:hypothetical protein